MKLCTRITTFCRNLCKKRQIWVCEPHFREVRGVARTWLMGRWKAHGRLSISIFALIELFRYLLRFRGYETKCVQLGCCRRDQPLCTRILPGQGGPHQPFLSQKTRDTGLHSSAFPRFDTILVSDGWTNRRMDGFAVAYTVLPERCKNWGGT